MSKKTIICSLALTAMSLNLSAAGYNHYQASNYATKSSAIMSDAELTKKNSG